MLSQWPLTCIRFYESTGRGQFSFDAGRRSPMGEGQYVFHTRRGQDNEIYDLLDRFIMETAGLARVSKEFNFDFISIPILDHLPNIDFYCPRLDGDSLLS